MIQLTLERAVRGRFWLPILLLLALAAISVNESTYQHSHSTLTRGIDLTDARLQAASTLQLLTDAESSARQYITSANADDQQAFKAAMAELPLAQEGVFRLIAKVDPQGLVSLAEVRSLILARMAALNSWVALAAVSPLTQLSPQAPPPFQALPSSETSRAQHLALRAAFDQLLQRAAAVQHTARVSLYSAMMLSRVAVHALVLMSVLGLVLWSRQLHKSDKEKDSARQLLATQVDERTAELRQLAGHLENAREDERGHLARELHDDMGGLLTAMKLELARLRRVPELPAAALERVLSIERRLNDGIALKRRIIENLRPSSLDQLGLSVALEMLCADVASNLGIPVVANLQTVRLNKDAELTVYRVVQESLTNISKYARATEVQVSLQPVGKQVRLTVQDDGKGFDVHRVASGHHGLLGMRVRLEAHAGKLTLRSAPGEGTSVCAELPQSAQPREVVGTG
jgi:signal transduction histidine kinase